MNDSLLLDCRPGKGDVASMESEYFQQNCWGHVGHHTYFMGGAYALHGGSGRAFSVEQQLAPPVESFRIADEGVAVLTPLALEVSLDGLSWTRVADLDYKFVGTPGAVAPSRQQIDFEFQADGDPFQFLRIRQPLSAAQGLSGYLDFSRLTIDATPVEAPTAGRSGALSCQEDILEDVWELHPCWFGGAHWDAPSFFHTYHVDGAGPVSGEATLVYFRPDDLGTCCGQTAAGVLDGVLLVQTSIDGAHWTTIASVATTYGVPTPFDAEADAPFAFLRVVSDWHPGYWEHPALKHPEAYVVHSAINV